MDENMKNDAITNLENIVKDIIKSDRKRYSSTIKKLKKQIDKLEKQNKSLIKQLNLNNNNDECSYYTSSDN
jgi:hypothetical protein